MIRTNSIYQDPRPHGRYCSQGSYTTASGTTRTSAITDLVLFIQKQEQPKHQAYWVAKIESLLRRSRGGVLHERGGIVAGAH